MFVCLCVCLFVSVDRASVKPSLLSSSVCLRGPCRVRWVERASVFAWQRKGELRELPREYLSQDTHSGKGLGERERIRTRASGKLFELGKGETRFGHLGVAIAIQPGSSAICLYARLRAIRAHHPQDTEVTQRKGWGCIPEGWKANGNGAMGRICFPLPREQVRGRVKMKVYQEEDEDRVVLHVGRT